MIGHVGQRNNFYLRPDPWSSRIILNLNFRFNVSVLLLLCAALQDTTDRIHNPVCQFLVDRNLLSTRLKPEMGSCRLPLCMRQLPVLIRLPLEQVLHFYGRSLVFKMLCHFRIMAGYFSHSFVVKRNN